jgi:hypothetical protein
MEDEHQAQQRVDSPEEVELLHRRDFFQSLKKWSRAVIGGVVLGALLPGSKAEAGWINSRGAWVNNGGGGWINRGGSWVNGHGGGGGSWVNRRGW